METRKWKKGGVDVESIVETLAKTLAGGRRKGEQDLWLWSGLCGAASKDPCSNLEGEKGEKDVPANRALTSTEYRRRSSSVYVVEKPTSTSGYKKYSTTRGRWGNKEGSQTESGRW